MKDDHVFLAHVLNSKTTNNRAATRGAVPFPELWMHVTLAVEHAVDGDEHRRAHESRMVLTDSLVTY